MATYVLAEAADGYSVLYSLAELDSDFQDSEVIVADTMNSLRDARIFNAHTLAHRGRKVSG